MDTTCVRTKFGFAASRSHKELGPCERRTIITRKRTPFKCTHMKGDSRRVSTSFPIHPFPEVQHSGGGGMPTLHRQAHKPPGITGNQLSTFRYFYLKFAYFQRTSLPLGKTWTKNSAQSEYHSHTGPLGTCTGLTLGSRIKSTYI